MNIDVSQIASVAIYPAIGIARVGNSPDGYFIGPTIPGTHPVDPDDFRDKEGRIKRQAAKFFVYALDSEGKVLGELNEANGAKVDWRVDIANKKSEWYNFDLALDIPAAEGAYDLDGNATPNGVVVCSAKRNLDFTGADRKKLMIEPTAIHISGPNKNPDGTRFQFDDGEINGKKVYLGELRTDEDGRLIFLGGRGKSQAFVEGAELTTFANNQGWHDDVSDGPVDAKVEYGGKTFEAEGSWVVVAPPNYAVGVQAFTTGFQLLEDVAYREGLIYQALKTDFWRDIFPTLKHLSINEWVNAGIQKDFGWGSAYDFDQAVLYERLKDPTDKFRPLRQAIFQYFRNPNYKVLEADSWPPLYGDAVTFNINSTDPRNFYAVTQLQYDHLSNWARGDFETGDRPTEKEWSEMSPAEQANGLTEAALEETLGGPFHPGCEFTWPMRHAMMFEPGKPFRIKRRPTAKNDFGICLNYGTALADGGPLDGSSAGDITRWMAVPWQTDTSSCLSAYNAYGGEFLPTFWPARVPNDVLTQANYDFLQNPNHGDEEKILAFSPDQRKKWLRGFIYDEQGNFLPDRFPDGITKFTHQWYKAGIVTKKPLQNVNPELFPKEVWVETGREEITSGSEVALKAAAPKASAKPSNRYVPDWVRNNPRSHR